MSRSLKPLLFSTILAISSAYLPAQTMAQANANSALMDRLERIERDMTTLQRQNARGSNTNISNARGDADLNPSVMGGVDGDTQQQITLLQEEVRSLRGELEKSNFEARKNADALQRLQKDVDFRLSELEKAPIASAPATSEPEAMDVAPEPEPIKKLDSKRKIVVQQVAEPIDESSDAIDTTTEALPVEKDPRLGKKPTTAGSGTLKKEPAMGDDPREQYNQAFRLLNQTRYEEAGEAFEAFTQKYGDDPLIGNAYYWLGETRYIQRDYVKAADSFRQGFEVLPSGPKAPDNLLKLAMTLRALNRNDDACTVLNQIKVKFKKSSSSLLEKTEQERTRIGCK
jgi:tol-pal system protein YbgF